MANQFFNRYLNNNIFEKYLEITDVFEDLYSKLLYSIKTSSSTFDKKYSKKILADISSNFFYIVKHQILNNRNVNWPEKLISQLNLDIIEKDLNYRFSRSHVLFDSKKSIPKWSDDFLRIFEKIIIPDAFHSNWDGNKIKELNQADETTLRDLVSKYLQFNSKIALDLNDEVFVESLVKFYKVIIFHSNSMRRENKFNYRQFVPPMVAEYTINWKKLRELI
jgi:hypothetical protein